MSQPRSVVHNLKHSNSHFNTRNRISTFEIALQHSKSHSNTRNRTPTLEIALQRSKSHVTRSRNSKPCGYSTLILRGRRSHNSKDPSTLEIAPQHSESRPQYSKSANKYAAPNAEWRDLQTKSREHQPAQKARARPHRDDRTQTA